MPYKAFQRGGKWQVFKLDADNEPDGAPLGEHDSEDAANEQVAALYANEEGDGDKPMRRRQHMSETVNELTNAVGEFSGTFPDVPYAAGVDSAALTADDANPLFVTLPIAQVGAESRNGLLYDDALVGQLEQQINAKRPGGIMGHISEKDRSTAFPVPDVYWVGAARHEDMLWGKGYVPPGKARDYIRRQKAIGGQIATSIYGGGAFETNGQGARRLAKFNLESLDLAPPDRAALQMERPFAVTSETTATPMTVVTSGGITSYTWEIPSDATIVGTATQPVTEIVEEHAMDKATVIAELTVADLPESLVAAVIAEHAAETQTQQQIAELTAERDAKATLVTELQTTVDDLTSRIAEYEAAQQRATLDGVVTELLAELALEDVRPFVRKELAGLDTEDAIRARFAEYTATDEYKLLAEAFQAKIAGPAAAVAAKMPSDIPGLTREFTEDERRAARARAGF